MLQVRGLTKLYSRIPAVENVNFTLRPGEILGYLGPNGSGKSTTVKMLTGLLEPSYGRIFFDGADVRKDPVAFKRDLGYVPEEPWLYTHLSGLEYLQLIGRLREFPEPVVERRANDLLRLFGISDSRYSPMTTYSKGMRQKVLIAAALLHNPRLLIFDEPFSGLDVSMAQVFKSLLRQLAANGRMILFSSHVLEVVEKVCSDVLILRQGKVVAHDSVANLQTLMSLASLEDVFSQLAIEQDSDAIAREILGAVA